MDIKDIRKLRRNALILSGIGVVYSIICAWVAKEANKHL